MNPTTESLWQEFRDGLQAFIRRRVSDDNRAKDILQDAFLRMHKSLRSGTTPLEPQAWVYSITRSAIADHYRAALSQTNRIASAANEPADSPRTAEDNVESSVVAELVPCVKPFIMALEAPYREALTLTALEGMSQVAAAKHVGVSLSGMKSRVQRGRRKLRKLFEACCAIEYDSRGKPIESIPSAGCNTIYSAHILT